jgi:glycosyltransferase involved in cell wall biosynthesis
MKRKILVIQPDLGPSGGGNAVAACIIEALKSENAVSVLSWAAPDLDAVNRVFATSLKSSEFTAHSAPLLLRALAKLNPYLYPLRYGILLRLCKKMRNDYDIMISVNNEADFGRKGIQYVHDPPYWFYHSSSKPRPNIRLLFPHHLWSVFKGKHRPWMLIAGFSYDRMKENITLVNSYWTGTKVREIYGIDSTTVYPPVLGSFPKVPWEDRENGLVCIGRILPWKKLEKIIEITEAVRSSVPETHLHIIGTIGRQRGYLDHLLHLVRDSSWIVLNENVPREELVRLIASHRYGIHGMVDEPFGMAVAEMVHGGCIVFVPRNAGPMEIVGGEDRLLYETTEEAVRKIIRVMRSPNEQGLLRSYLDSRRDMFCREQFVQRIQQIVEQFPERIQSCPHKDSSHHWIPSSAG